MNSKWDKSKEWDVGLYCLNSVCTALKARNSAVDVSKDEQCIFGTLPDSNGKCSPFGTVFIGSKVPGNIMLSLSIKNLNILCLQK